LAGQSLVDGSVNVAIGGLALATCVSGNTNTVVGHSAMEGGTGNGNSILGYNAGKALTTGSYNTIVGYYNGLTTESNRVILADGQQSVVLDTAPGYSVALYGASIQAGTGITFPATQSASANANTLDDYEEGTWTPTDNSGASLTFTDNGSQYTKVGRAVTINFEIAWPTTADTNNVSVSLPIPSGGTNRTGMTVFSNVVGEVNIYTAGGANFILYNDIGTRITNATMSGKYLIVSLTYFV